MSGRLDDDKLETLRSWGAGLAGDGRDELRAAGKAILILLEEIDRLQVDMWHKPGDEGPVGDVEPPAERSLEDVAEDFLSSSQQETGLDSTLRGRVGRLLGAKPVRKR